MALELSFSRYRKAIILVALVLLVVVGGFVWMHSTQTGGGAEGGSGRINITALHSDVFVKEADANFVPVPGQATTTSGSTIRTSETGRALIESSAAHRTLVDYSSEIVLNETAAHTEVGLLSGAVWSRLAKVFDSGEYYEVKSPNAIAAVRGTSFGVWYSEGITTLIVTEGSVVFSAVDPETGLPIPGTEGIVTAGQKAVCGRDGKIVVTELTKMDYALPWVVFNDSEDSPGAVPAVSSSPNQPVSDAVVPSTPPEPTTPSVSIPKISVVSPSNIDAGSKERITVKGSGFEGVTTVLVGTRKALFEVLQDDTITLWAGDVGPGTYDVTVTEAGGKSDTRSNALTVHEVIPVNTDPLDKSTGYNQAP